MLQVLESAVGKKVKCPKCAGIVTVPDVAAPVTSAYLPMPLPAAPPAGEAFKSCPFCSEKILVDARKCKHCGEMLDPLLRTTEEARRSAQHSVPVVMVHQASQPPATNPLSYSSSPFLSAFGNLLWIFLGGGIVLFLEYLVAGCLLCLTIVGIPFGIQAFKMAGLALLPFGRRVMDKESAAGCLSLTMNLLWVIFAGIPIALTHLFFALLCAVTIVLLPFALQHVKLAALGLAPFGKEVR
jgi:uncharacterized membrane protein YccF (DUF307 family)